MAAQLDEIGQDPRIAVRITGVKDVAVGVRSFEFSRPQSRELPYFRPGAHIDVHLDSGKVRQYSLCGSPSNRHTYRIAVQCERRGRGGSKEIFETWHPGKTMLISGPRNHFELVNDRRSYLLIAGGIGITPVLPMAMALEERGATFHLYYCTRNRERTAFVDDLAPLIARGCVTVHHDEGVPERQFDFSSLLSKVDDGACVYYCGPAPMMQALERATAHWPRECVHREFFSASADESEGAAFRVRLQRSGESYEIPPNKSIVQVLREAGVPVDVSCEEGVCGTCRTRYLAGEPIHHDLVLSDAEREQYVMICRARCKSAVLVLDC